MCSHLIAVKDILSNIDRTKRTNKNSELQRMIVSTPLSVTDRTVWPNLVENTT